jgi:putative ABC transport system permease protein
MRDGGFAVAWYRLRTTLHRRWAGYVSLVVLVALVGGLGLGSLAAARRTQSSFTTFVASTNPSDLFVTIYGNGGGANNPSDNGSLARAMAKLPHVKHVAEGTVLVGAPLARDGTPRIRVDGLAYPVASSNRLFFSQDRLGVSQGRMSSPGRPDEIVMAPVAAKLLGFHVGQVIPYGFYSQSQQSEPGFGTKAVAPALRVNMKLVGLASLDSEIVEDDVDTLPTFVPLTPALTREITRTGQQFSGGLTFGIRTEGGAATVPAVQRELTGLIPPNVQYSEHALAPVVAKADRAVKPISIALGVFGALALLAALLIATQVMARRLRVEADDLDVLRALGAGPTATLLDGILGLEVAIVAGSILAAVFAFALSPVAPLGPVRSVYPSPGFAADWTVIGLGVLLLGVVLSAIALLLATLGAPHRVALRPRLRSSSGARLVGSLARAGLPAPGVVGVRMALEQGEARRAVPVRSVLFGATLAVVLVVATLTFGDSLRTLVSTPPLYGWNWSYVINEVGSGGGNVPPMAQGLLRHDPYVAGDVGMDFVDVEIDGQGVPILLTDAGSTVAPPVVTGHGLTGAHQVVLGAATLAALHKRVGQDVTVSYGNPSDAPLYVPPTRLLIVGSATFPAIGFASTVSDHTSMGTGALVPFQALPRTFLSIEKSNDPVYGGPNLVLVRLRADAPPQAALASLQRIARAVNEFFAAQPGGSGSNSVVVQGVQRPAEIVNYRTIGATPALLASGLALGAVVALALTLIGSVRQRRRDLAVLKTIGFVRRQLAAAIAWQATVAAAVGIVVGIPLGVVAGRWLWDLFARQIYAVPDPTVSGLAIVLVALGTLLLANMIAAVPAWTAAQTPTALALRAE